MTDTTAARDVLRTLIGEGLTLTDILAVYSEQDTSDRSAAYVAAAREMWSEDADGIAVDAFAIVSGTGDDADGDFVLGWLWVSREDAGLPSLDNENDEVPA